MKTETANNNPHAMTGKSSNFGIDYARGFYSCEVIGSIDAPVCVPAGSTFANEISYPADHNCADLNGRYVTPAIAFRAA